MTNPPEFRHIRSGSLNIPNRSGLADGMMAQVPGARFDGPRSPPNTSHVPCKFFRQGACQAGNACPFSHDIGAAAENVCKYFAKGNCKFGPKCANIHVLPDGRRINYGKNGVTIGAAAINLGARVNPTTYHHPSNSALTNSFMRGDVPAYTATSPFGGDDRYHQLGRQPSLEAGLPTIDTTYSSNPASAYGSPRDDDPSRFGLGLSPVNTKGLSVLDAPLPASFDSNGISHAARYGPWPSSVPSKFGLDSPSPSLNPVKDLRNSGTLKMLHQTAFGSDERLPGAALSGVDSGGFGSSPPTGSTPHGMGLLSDEYFGKRTMHSSSLRYSKPRLLSSSVPKVDRDWEAEFLFEEDYVPGTLANEVLTPAEKARRGSATNTLRAFDPDAPSEPLPTAAATKFGSPGTVGSPSRWGPLFQRQRDEDALLDSGNGSLGANRSMKHVASAFGHVGSPLRNSSLASGLGAEVMASGSPSNGHMSSGSIPGSAGESFSVLTQQLQRTRIGDESSGNSSPHLHPNTARATGGNGLGSFGAGIIGRDRERERGLERHVSSGSIGSSVTGRFTTPIDEEDPAFVFSMEEEDDAQTRARKRISGGHLGTSSPLGTGWTYASAVAGKGTGPSAVNGSNTSDPAAVETIGSR